MDQAAVLSYSLNQIREALVSWFPRIPVSLWEGKYREEIVIVLLDIKQGHGRNRNETLRIVKPGGKSPDSSVEVQVPVPRMVDLRVALVPAFKSAIRALDVSARIHRSVEDNPFFTLGDYNWYGNESGKAMMNLLDSDASYPLPGELEPFQPYRWDLCIQLGINSSQEERVVRVIQRQFSAVKK